LELKVQPRSSCNQIVGLYGTALKIKLTSPPVDGAANKTCQDFLSKKFGIAKTSIKIVSGESSRHKIVLLKGISYEQVRSVLTNLLSE